MSETKRGPRKPYGTAIFWLGVARQGLTEAGQREIASAIRVLDAAGKLLSVTENGVLTLDTFWEVFVKATDKSLNKKDGVYRIRYEAIRTLLSALPDKGEK